MSFASTGPASGRSNAIPTLRLPLLGPSITGKNEEPDTPPSSPITLTRPRWASPYSACSTLITSAPQSASTAAADGTKVYCATSRTRTPFIGRCIHVSLLELMSRLTESQNAGHLLDHRAGVDSKLHASDVSRLIGGQEHHGVADVDGLDVRNWHRLHGRESDLGIFAGGRLEVGAEQRIHRLGVQQIRVAVGGVNGVDPDAARRHRQRRLADELSNRAFGKGIATSAGAGGRPIGRAGDERGNRAGRD